MLLPFPENELRGNGGSVIGGDQGPVKWPVMGGL